MQDPAFVRPHAAPLQLPRPRLHPRRPRTTPFCTADKPSASIQPASSPGPLARRDANIPTLFAGPEAVLGIVLAAAALLVDFTRGLSRVISRASADVNRQLTNSLADVDRSIELLQNALDDSKAMLQQTEAALDESMARASSAEQALLGIGDSREQLRRALDQATEAEIEVMRITESLKWERERRKDLEEEGNGVALDAAVRRREGEIEELGVGIKDLRRKGEGIWKGYLEKEGELREEIGKKEGEVEDMKRERERLGREKVEMEKRKHQVEKEVEKSTIELEETKKELERVREELDGRGEVEGDMKRMMRDLEREVDELQNELRARDQVVNEVAKESDQLRSLLMARDAELRDVSERLRSAIAAEDEGGDSRRSDMSLEEVKWNLDAEQLAFSAEIAKAEIAKSDISSDELDPLDRLKMEMDAEGDLLKAGLKKAESTVRVAESELKRKDNAVENILESIEGEEVEVFGEKMPTKRELENEIGKEVPVGAEVEEQMQATDGVDGDGSEEMRTDVAEVVQVGDVTTEEAQVENGAIVDGSADTLDQAVQVKDELTDPVQVENVNEMPVDVLDVLLKKEVSEIRNNEEVGIEGVKLPKVVKESEEGGKNLSFAERSSSTARSEGVSATTSLSAEPQPEALGIAKQAQSKTAGSEVKPKKRRGRTSKTKREDSVAETDTQKPKRKRGRPRKTPLPEE